MSPGSVVIFTSDPLMYGRMLVLEVTSAGLLLCESLHERLDDGSYRRDVFHPQELTEDQRELTITQTGLPRPKSKK